MQRVNEMKYFNVEQIKIREFKWETKGNIDICNNKIDNSTRSILKNMAESKSINTDLHKFDLNDCVFHSRTSNNGYCSGM